MNKTWTYPLLVGVVLLAAVSIVCAADKPPIENSDRSIAFRNDMRRLWEDHTIYTHNVIASMLSSLPDTDAELARLMRNQADMGEAVKPYYGDAAGDKLTALLKDHIAIAGDILAAAKAGDNAKLEDAKQRWSANANDIAVFLSGANPQNWPLATLQALLNTHLQMVTDQAVARLKGDWAADIVAFDQGQDHVLKIADALSLGIIRQFPDKFTGPVLTGTEPVMLSCPVLGTTMPKDKMIPYTYQGKTYYFCCPPCVEKFKADPQQYIEHPAKPKPPGQGM